MELALDRFDFTARAEFNNRVAMKGDLEFYVGDQWDANIRNNRKGEQRPCLSVNQLPQFTRQVTNGLRQNMPQIHCIPVNDSDEEVSDILEGMMRHIQEASHASIAYSTANQSQVVAGQGFFRLVTEYVNEDSFDQEIRIKRIKNALAVYVDPMSVEPDYSDASYMFLTEDITQEEFKRRYPDKQAVSNDILTGKGDRVKQWMTDQKGTMRIAEYFTVEEKDGGTLYQLANGKIVKKLRKGQESVKERTVKERVVKWRMISGVEVLEEKKWDGKYIPIIPVLGEDMDVDGDRFIKGMVRDAQDPQRMYNYWVSAQTEMIALAPKAPYIAEYSQIEDFKFIWESANTQNWAYLPYKASTANGTPIPPPQRQNAEPPVQAMTQAMAQASNDLRSVTGIYNASLGAQSNEVSGKAINARKLQGDVSNYHFIDNFASSITYLGKQLLDLIPKIYDTTRVVRILGLDGTAQYKTINGPSGEKDIQGLEKVYDVTTGEYDVVVEVGPSYKTKRQQDADNMSQVLQSNPQLWAIAGDLLVQSMDWPDAKQLAERIKKTLPPELQDTDPNQEIPIQVKQQLDQSGKMIDQLTQTVHKLQDIIETKEVEAQRDLAMKKMERESIERVEYAKLETAVTTKAMGIDGQANHAVMTAELASIGKKEASVQQADLASHNFNLQSQTVESPNPQLDNGNNNATVNSETAGGNAGQ